METKTSNNVEPSLTMEGFLRLQAEMRAKHGPPLTAVKISSSTLATFPLVPFRDPKNPISTLYGVPVEIDESLDLFECKPVYTEGYKNSPRRKGHITCWLCGGVSTQTCQCHDRPHSGKHIPCNMVCNA